MCSFALTREAGRRPLLLPQVSLPGRQSVGRETRSEKQLRVLNRVREQATRMRRLLSWTSAGLAMMVVLFSTAMLVESSSDLDPQEMCASVRCPSGRECRVLSSGEAECVCARSCPSPSEHHKRNRHRWRKGRKNNHHRHRWVCGSDGLYYESHCHLHREACIKGVAIRPVPHDHSCKKDPLIQLKQLVQKAADEVKQMEIESIEVPESCHQNERNRMREFLMSWMTLTAPKHHWYQESLTFPGLLGLHFNESDADGNGFLDAFEWLSYFHKNKTHRAEENREVADKDRLLCLDALVEEGDRDQDWRLDKSEFLNLMGYNYQPSNKYCVMDRKHFEDGTKTKVDCNGCVCACGKWICTSHPCSDPSQQTAAGDSDADDDESEAELKLELKRRRKKPISSSSSEVTSASPDDETLEGSISTTQEIFTYDDMDNIVQ